MHQIISSAGYTGEGRLGRRANTNQLSRITAELPPLIMFACGWKHNVFLTKERQVFVCGENTEGQIGSGQGTCLEPTLSHSLSELKPTWLSCGDKITALLTESKTVFVCGFEWGPDPVELTPSTESIEIPIVYIACGVDNICGISSEGKLYVWYRKSKIAKHCECPDVLCDVAAGKNQIFGLATNGNLWVLGHSKTCGMGKKWSSLTLTRVSIGNGAHIKRIFAYSLLSIAIDVEGRVFVCGANNYGELGIPSMKKANVFQRLTALDGKPVIMATIGDTFVAYITEKYELYTCGDGDEYRLCNNKIDKVITPSKATAAEGHKIMWACAGCSHIILAEGMEEFPVHPGREHFNLEGTMKMRRKKYNPQLIELMSSPDGKSGANIADTISVDTTDRGTEWTCFMPGDEIKYNEDNGLIVGCTSNGVVLKIDNNYRVFNIKSIAEMHNNIKLMFRPFSQLKQIKTKSGLNTKINVSNAAIRAFGFAFGDQCEDIFGSHASVVGVLGGCLWFSYPEDDGIVTISVDDIMQLHQNMKIICPHERSIKYLKIDGHDLPVEERPCSLLSEFGFALNDLVDCHAYAAQIIGTFRHFIVLNDFINEELLLANPSELYVLRRFSELPILVSYLTLSGKFVKIDVSCKETDEFMPFDRVSTLKGSATIVGKFDDKWWILPDESTALGAGVASTKQPFSSLLRRLSQTKTIVNEVDVSTNAFVGTGVLPDDVIVLNEKKYTVVGIKNGKAQLVNQKKANTFVPIQKLKEAAIVFRADLAAKRMYYSKTGNGLYLSVSSRDFFGLRFLPDDVIKTPKGIGLVVGVSESDVCVHLNETRGVSFFPIADLYNVQEYLLIERRSIQSIIIPCLSQ